MKEIKLDLGCGQYKRMGYIGLDNNSLKFQQNKTNDGPDIIIDLFKENLPYEDGTVTAVYTSHFLEHCPCLDHIFEEVDRVLKPGGLFEITVPFARSDMGIYPGHIIFLTDTWFKLNPHFNFRFDITEIRLRMTDVYKNSDLFKMIPPEIASKVLFNSIDQMEITSVKKDGQKRELKEIFI